MRYNEPYGGAADAPYVNGDPSIGLAGSIPPAAAIEYTQREIANFIADAGLTPANTDLRQLGKGIQTGRVIFASDTGTPNQLVATLSPAPDDYYEGMHLIVLIANNNYVGGPSTINLNGLGAKSIKHLDGTELTENELVAGQMALLAYDGTVFQWMTAPFKSIVTGTLTENRDYYVNPSTGLDTNDGLTAGTPFKTINHAVQQCIFLNLDGYTITIHCADGTYPENVELYPLNGNGTVHIVGNVTTPANCTINPLAAGGSGGGYCIHWGSIYPTEGWFVRGFKLTSTATFGGYQGMGVFGGFGAVALENMEFGACEYAHLAVSSSCKITIGGPSTYWRISGGAPYHMIFTSMSELLNYEPQMVVTNTPNFSSYFISCHAQSFALMKFTSITGSATGARYHVAENGIIHTAGSGASYLPGNSAGLAETQGQYL